MEHQGSKLFEGFCLSKAQHIVGSLKLYLDKGQHEGNKPIIIMLSDNSRLFNDFFGDEAIINFTKSHKSLLRAFESDDTIIRIDSKGNIFGISISKFHQDIRQLYEPFMECISDSHNDSLLMFTKKDNVYIAHCGSVTQLSLALNNEDLHYHLPKMIPLDKGCRVNVGAFGFVQPGTIIDYEYCARRKEIIYTVRCEKNIYHKLNYYQIFNRTNPKIYYSEKRKALQQKSDVISLQPPTDNPSNAAHPLHFIFLAFVESSKQCYEYIQHLEDAKAKTVIYQLQESGFTFLFYHTLILETDDEVIQYRSEKKEEDEDQIEDEKRKVGNVDGLNTFMQYLEKDACISKVNKYEHPKTFHYDDLCNQCSSILGNVGKNNKVFVCHIVETEREVLTCYEEEANNEDGDNEDWLKEEHEDDDYDSFEDNEMVKKYRVEKRSSFEYSIKYDFEICAVPSETMKIEEVMTEIKEKWEWGTMDKKLLNYFYQNNIFNVYDVDYSSMNVLKSRIEQQMTDDNMRRLYKTFNGYVYRFDDIFKSQKSKDLKQNLVHSVEVSRNAQCVQQIIEKYRREHADDGNNSLVIGYNPLQCVVATSKEIRDVTHCAHLYQSAHDEGFYSDAMIDSIMPDWMFERDDARSLDKESLAKESLVKIIFDLLRRNQRYDIILVPSSVNLDETFLSESCCVIAPRYQAVSEYQNMFLYKGNVYRIKNKSMIFDENERIFMDEVKLTLRHLMDKSDKNGKQKWIQTSSRDQIDKWLNIGCGACFLQQTNGQSTKVKMWEEKQLRECLFLNGIDCKIPYNEDIIEDKKQCAICMDLQIKPATIGNEECSHSFCYKCIDQWYKRAQQTGGGECPLCRRKIIKIEHNKQMEREMMEGIPLTIYQEIVDKNESLYQRLRAIDAFEQRYRN